MGNDEDQAKENFVKIQNNLRYDYNSKIIKNIGLDQFNRYQEVDETLTAYSKDLTEAFKSGDIKKYNDIVTDYNKRYPNNPNNQIVELRDPPTIAVAPSGVDGFYLIDLNPLTKGKNNELNYPDVLVGKDGNMVIEFGLVVNEKYEAKYTEILNNLCVKEEKDADGKWHFYKTDPIGGNPITDKKSGKKIEVPFIELYLKIIEKMPDLIKDKTKLEDFKNKYNAKDTQGSIQSAAKPNYLFA
ncbi:MAG: hypothetical protein NTX79_01705 [Candidatus Micrarchaeota archaeon]|nr:hypothetical protein [Candidatus Micrarchaeota archaeon]